MAVYPLTMIPRFRKRNRERERAVTRQIEFHGKFSASPLPWKRHSNHYRTNFEAMFECPRSPSWLNWKILFSSLIIRTHIHIYTKIYSLFYIEEEKKGRVRLWFVSKRCEIEGEESKVDANYVKCIISLTLASFISFTHKMENKEANACERKGVSRDFSSSIINSFLLHVKRTT